MPSSYIPWQTIPTEEGFYSTEIPSLHARPVRIFLPTGYEPNYPYPLVVFFHGQGGCEEQILELAPRISRRNFICISLRGPQCLGLREDGLPGYGWGDLTENQAFLEEYMLRSVEFARRSYHIHSERVYLAGFWEGASLAYRLGLSMPDKIAGIISLNGTMPRPSDGSPLFRLPDVRKLRVFIGHGVENTRIPLEQARRDCRVLYSAGVDIRMNSYPTTDQIHAHMLRDINRWIIANLDAEFDAFANIVD